MVPLNLGHLVGTGRPKFGLYLMDYQWEVVFATLMTSDFNVVTTLKSDVVAASCSGCILTSEMGQWEVVFATPMTSDFFSFVERP